MTDEPAEVVVTLTAEEAAVLASVITDVLGELHDEVYKTENYEWRQGLKQRGAILRAVLARLQVPST
jgi:hypothetical protein